MGNSHSQHHQIPTHQWTHSYPRPRQCQPQVKVLPERLPPLRLRTTDNGAILHNGGTISCRKQCQEERVHRPRSSSAHRPPKLDEIGLDKGRFGSEPDLRFHLKESRDQFVDNAIRQRISRSRKKYKAPPAPQNGMSSGMESSSPDLNGWESTPKDCTSGPGRKVRLFKTRAETNKKSATALKKMETVDLEISKSPEALDESRAKFREEKLIQSTNEDKEKGERIEKKGLKRSASHEVMSTKKSLATPEFQAELLEVAQRLRPPLGFQRHSSSGTRPGTAKLSAELHTREGAPSDVVVPKENELKPNKKISQTYLEESADNNCCRSEASRSKPEPGKEKVERDVPSKKFYFGMEENNNEVKIVNNRGSTNNVDKTNTEHRITAVERSKNLMNLYKSAAEGNQDWEDSVDKFAANFHKPQVTVTNGNTTSCSSSFVSEPDEDIVGGIALQLRPTLPKKQLEIPRFSPTAAWRLLSSVDPFCQSPSPGESEEGPLLLEDRIDPPASQQGLRGSHDKSGDSGISGDASPGGCHESSSEIAVTSGKTAATQNSKNILMAWTPQQDLEEESSSEDLESPLNSSKNAVSNIPGAKFSPRGQLFLSRDHSFSLSISKEERMCLYSENPADLKDRSNVDSAPKLNSLKKLKVALGTSKRNEVLGETSNSKNDNWLLSRSVPGSLNNGHVAAARSFSNPSSPEQDDEHSHQASLKCPSYSYLANGGRMMYLPEYHSRMSPEVSGKRPRTSMGNGFLSKSCENIMQWEMKQVVRSRTPSPVAGRMQDAGRLPPEDGRDQKKKKFTFQSTVRLIENRRIAERLSREAELKENQRLSEVEAMRKVEEEFQKKRAREKATIRHQLRLFSLEEKNYSSLPPGDWEEGRGEPEGVLSSLPPPSSQKKFSSNRKTSGVVDLTKFASSTQVLSEYREPVRDYRDYRHLRLHEPQDLPQENNKRSVVEHPRVVYDMPKNTAVYVSAPTNSVSAQYKDESRVAVSTPRSSSSDNYRKDFAHGALAAGGRSLTSSDSEHSQSQPRSASRQGATPRKWNPTRRSRSGSPESLSPPSSPHRGLDSSASPPGTRSASPVNNNLVAHKSRPVSPKKTSGPDVGENGSEHGSLSKNKFSHSLERKCSVRSEYRSIVDRKHEHQDQKQQSFSCPRSKNIGERPTRNSGSLMKSSSTSLLRLGLPSLQPFDKTEKSFRPINFNPVMNKLAQIVN